MKIAAPHLIMYKLVGMAALWGGAFVGVRYVSQFVGPFTGAGLRFMIGAAALAVVVRGWPRLSLRQWWGLLLLAATGVFGYNALFFVGMKEVEAARGALIIALGPVFVSVVAALFLGETMCRRQVLGVGLSLFGGAAVIVGGGKGFTAALGGGEIALLGCVASWVAYSLCGKKLLASLPVLPVVFGATLLGSAMLLLAALCTEPLAAIGKLPALAWLALVLMGVGSTALAYCWYYEGIVNMGAVRAANFINLVPVFAAILGALLLGEWPGIFLLGGGSLVIIGVIMVNRQVK